MTPAAEWLDDPLALCTFLRERGLRVGTGEALRISAVLDRLGQRGAKPRSAPEATLYLAPLLCTSAAQQALLPRLIAEFESLHRPVVLAATPAPLPAPAPREENWLEQLLRQPLALAVISLALVAAALTVFYFVGTGAGPTPAAPSPPDMRGWFKLPTLDLVRLVQGLPFVILPLGVFFLFYSWYCRRPVVLQRARTSAPEERDKRTLADPTAEHFTLFGALELSRPLQAMRAHRLAPSSHYDFAASVRATAKHGGFLTLVPEMRPMLPEYPLLIEQLSGKDHVAALARALVARLATERVAVSSYTFSTDLRLLRGDARRLLGLGDILSRHGGETLIVVSDGEALIDPLTGAPNAAAAELVAWTNPVLLTPLPLERWAQREHALAEAGLLVLPATPEGLGALAQKLAGQVELVSPALRLRGRRDLIGRELHTLAWHHDEPMPSPQERAEILDAIAAELPAAAFELLCVLARFPEVRLDLTLHMGLKLKRRDGRPLLDEESFGALAWLPWMRLGRLPDWLRLDLIRCLSDQRCEDARKLYERWLAPGLARRGGDDTELAAEPGLFDRLLRRHVVSDKTTPLRDVIFLKSQRGEAVSDLDLRVPDTLRHLMRPRWTDPEWIAGAAALVLALAGFWFAPQLEALKQGSPLPPEAAPIIAILVAPVAAFLWHLAAYLTRWQTLLRLLYTVAILLVLVVLAFGQSGKDTKDTAFFVLTAVVMLPPFCLALCQPTAGPPERPQPAREIPFFPYLVLASLFVVTGETGILLTPFVLALVLARMLGLSYWPVMAGAILGMVPFVYWLAVLAGAAGMLGVSNAPSIKPIASALLQLSILSTLYCAILTAVVLGRVRLTRFLIIAGVGAATIVLVTAAEAAFVRFQSGIGFFSAFESLGFLYSANLPIAALCLILTHLALVRPDAMRAREVVLGCLVFAVAVTTIDVLASFITPPIPNPFVPEVVGKAAAQAQIQAPVQAAPRGGAINLTIGAALPFLFVPGAVAAILAALANRDARRERRAPEQSIWFSSLRAFAAVYAPPVWLLAVPLLWLTTIRFPLGSDLSVNASLLFIPIAAALGAWFGVASRLAVLLGGLPLLITLTSLAPIYIFANPGIFLAGLLVHQLFADAQFRTRVFFADSIAPIALIALILALAGTYQFVSPQFSFGGSLWLALYYVLFLIGASRIPDRLTLFTLLGVGVATLGLNVVLGLNAPPAPGVQVLGGFIQPNHLGTAFAFLLLGRFFMNTQLPAVLQADRPDLEAEQTIKTILIGGMFWLVLLSHVDFAVTIGQRFIGGGVLGGEIVHAVCFLLGFSYGRGGLLLAVVIVTLAEIIPALLLGNRLTGEFFGGAVRLGLPFGDPLTAALTRLDDFAFLLCGWWTMRAFRPAARAQASARQENAAPDAPIVKAA